MDKLSELPSALVQDEHTWSIYVSADAAELPAAIFGVGIDPNRATLVDRMDGDGDPELPAREPAVAARTPMRNG